MIYLACLWFTFSWRADGFYEQKVIWNPKCVTVKTPGEFDISTYDPYKTKTSTYFTVMRKFDFFPRFSKDFLHQTFSELNVSWVLKLPLLSYFVRLGRSHIWLTAHGNTWQFIILPPEITEHGAKRLSPGDWFFLLLLSTSKSRNDYLLFLWWKRIQRGRGFFRQIALNHQRYSWLITDW